MAELDGEYAQPPLIDNQIERVGGYLDESNYSSPYNATRWNLKLVQQQPARLKADLEFEPILVSTDAQDLLSIAKDDNSQRREIYAAIFIVSQATLFEIEGYPYEQALRKLNTLINTHNKLDYFSLGSWIIRVEEVKDLDIEPVYSELFDLAVLLKTFLMEECPDDIPTLLNPGV